MEGNDRIENVHDCPGLSALQNKNKTNSFAEGRQTQDNGSYFKFQVKNAQDFVF
jgi:hypothetical protein